MHAGNQSYHSERSVRRTASRTFSTKLGDTESSSIPILRNRSVSVVSAGKLAAYSYPCAVLVGVLGAHFNEPEYSLMVRVDKLLNIGVLSVAGSVYCVRSLVPTLKKSTIGASLSLISAAAGSLYHDTKLDFVGVLNAIAAKLRLDLLAYFLDTLDFLHAGYHREHYAEIAVNGSAVQRPELRFEYLGAGKADTDSAIA